MKRLIPLALLAATLLAGCATGPKLSTPANPSRISATSAPSTAGAPWATPPWPSGPSPAKPICWN